MDDESIISLFVERSEQAITEVKDKYGWTCTSIAYRILSSIEDSEDASICYDDFFSAVWDATDLSGKRYSVITNFTLDGVMVPASLVGKRTGWTFEEFQSIISETNVLKKITKQEMLYRTFDTGKFVDANSNTASFNSETFIKYLEYINLFLQSDSEIIDDGQASQMAGIQIMSIYDTQQEQYSSLFWNGGPVCFLGFPSENAEGMSIGTVSGLELGIISTGNQTGAWDVISYALSDEFQSVVTQIGIPARIESLNRLIKEAQDAENYPSSCAEVLRAIIANAGGKRTWDSTIDAIIMEETAAFFSGDKTAQDVAAIIQNRVNIYLSEQS